jgi:hypothetical protein
MADNPKFEVTVAATSNTAAPRAPTPVLLAAVLCEDTVRSERDRRLSLHKVRYVVTTATWPARLGFEVAAIWWLRGPGTHTFTVRVRDVDGGVLEVVTDTRAFERESVHEQLTHLAAIDFTQPGVYPVEVLIDGEVAGAYPLFLLALLETGVDGLGGNAQVALAEADGVLAEVPVGA